MTSVESNRLLTDPIHTAAEPGFVEVVKKQDAIEEATIAGAARKLFVDVDAAFEKAMAAREKDSFVVINKAYELSVGADMPDPKFEQFIAQTKVICKIAPEDNDNLKEPMDVETFIRSKIHNTRQIRAKRRPMARRPS